MRQLERTFTLSKEFVPGVLKSRKALAPGLRGAKLPLPIQGSKHIAIWCQDLVLPCNEIPAMWFDIDDDMCARSALSCADGSREVGSGRAILNVHCLEFDEARYLMPRMVGEKIKAIVKSLAHAPTFRLELVCDSGPSYLL